MALSLSSLDIINPQYSHGSLLEENIPEIFDFYYETHPPQNLSLQADDCQSFASSVISFDRINQIMLPTYNSISHEEMKECNSWVNTLDQNYYHVNQYGNNSINSEIGENMYCEDSQYVHSYPISHIDYVQESLKQDKVSQKRKFEVLIDFILTM